MVISPILTGLLGLDLDALLQQVTLRPHVPIDWTNFAVNHIEAGECRLNLRYRKSADRMTFEIERTAGTNCNVELAPAVSLRAQVMSVEVNGHGVPYHVQENEQDQHVSVHVRVVDRPAIVEFRLRNDFGLSEEVTLPTFGKHEPWASYRQGAVE